MDHRAEVGLAAGFYSLSSVQHLGGLDQLGRIRGGALGATLAAVDLRAALCPWTRLCVGALVTAAPGVLAERGALVLSYRGELVVHLLTGRLMPFVGVTAGGISLLSRDDALGRDTDPVAGWIAGLKLRLGHRWRLRLGLSHLMTDAQEGAGAVAHNLSVTAGVDRGLLARPSRSQRTPPMDPDGDGLVAPMDRCPEQAEDPDGHADDDGCPDVDNDGDGIDDPLDVCPSLPGPGPRGCPRHRRRSVQPEPQRDDGQVKEAR